MVKENLHMVFFGNMQIEYYCKLCDYGTFAKQLIEKHNKSDKHERREKYCK